MGKSRQHRRLLLDVMMDWDFDISELDMDDFPFEGAFYTTEVDEDAPLDERIPQEVEVFRTVCDIQRSAKLHNGFLLGADYTVYWPLEINPDSTGTVDKYGPIKVRRGMIFRGIMYGYPVVGTVEIVRPSQLGGCSCDIKVVTES